jgi:hypothetical protein
VEAEVANKEAEVMTTVEVIVDKITGEDGVVVVATQIILLEKPQTWIKSILLQTH